MKDELREAVRKLRDEVDAKVPEWWAGETIRDRLDAILSSHPPQSEPQGLREAVARWLWNDRDSWKGMLSWEEAPERNVYLAKADSLIVTLTLLAQPSAPADGGLRAALKRMAEMFRESASHIGDREQLYKIGCRDQLRACADEIDRLLSLPATPEGAQETKP